MAGPGGTVPPPESRAARGTGAGRRRCGGRGRGGRAGPAGRRSAAAARAGALGTHPGSGCGHAPSGRPAPRRAAAPAALVRGAGAALARPVYLAGYLGLSGSWLLLALALWLCWGLNRRGKRDRLAAAFALLEDEREAVCRGLAARHLPAWVHFPDVERVEWLNKVLVQAWPYFGTIMEKTFKEVLEPKIRAKSVHLKTCTFTKIHFGEKCPRINGIKAYTKEIDRRQVTLDLVPYHSALLLCLQLYGTLRVILEPLLTDAPFVGAVTLFFMQKPHLEINWAGMSNLLDVPGINVMSDSLIQDFIAARLVLPNRITVPLKKNMNIAHLRFPVPQVSCFFSVLVFMCPNVQLPSHGCLQAWCLWMLHQFFQPELWAFCR
uniref:SMP-LTD domain-containing protein n=1 Tax=Malurus cyaneus samueli TaxID=2593467 RepID=A0A8C5TQY0_9PASS